MIVVSDLRKIARARLEDTAVLCTARRYDGAAYVCGYAVEMALKARISRTLKWNAYSSTASEFQKYQSFRTHDLGVFLHLSGRREKIKTSTWLHGQPSRTGRPTAVTASSGRHWLGPPRRCSVRRRFC